MIQRGHTPDYLIIADGLDVTATFYDRLVSLEITDDAGEESDAVELKVDNRDFRIAIPETGTLITIALGFRETGLVNIGSYTVEDVMGDGPPETITVTGLAAAMSGKIKAPRTRSWPQAKLTDIVAVIAGEYGLTPSISDAFQGVAYPFLAQTAESDLHFLSRLARPLDAIVKSVSQHLVFAKRGQKTATDGKTLPLNIYNRADLSYFSWKYTGRKNIGRVDADWYDAATGEVKTVSADDQDPAITLRHRYNTEAEARRAANASLDEAFRGYQTCTAELAGFDPTVFSGAIMTLTGVQPEFTGHWTITHVEHRLDRTLTTTFNAERLR